jgi:hypothetical protein
MKKTLVLAALMSAAFALPTVPASAADLVVTETGVDAVCYILPLLPDCVAQWNEEFKANGYHWTPLPVAWWTCEKAEANAGHLLDCDTDA